MKGIYRDCTIEAVREKSCGGWDEVYWSAFTKDGYELTSGFGGGTVREEYSAMKMRVDEFLDECDGDTDKWEKYNYGS